MDERASRTEYTFWSLWSAPLLISTDVRNMSSTKKNILMNKEGKELLRLGLGEQYYFLF